MVAVESPDDVVFCLPDRQRRLARVRLAQEIGIADRLDLVRTAGQWTTRVDNPGVDRMEYLFELEDHNANRWTITDPGNSLRAPGAFGEKSVLEFPSYRRPAWLGVEGVAHEVTEHPLELLGHEVTVPVWSPSGLAADEPAPLLAVHDGPEYAALGELTGFVGVAIAQRRLPPMRVALLDPGDRNVWYSADPAYAAALCEDVLPALAPATWTVGVGVSLGALAMLHAHRSQPGTFDGLLLQSGSFFTADLDPQESGFDAFATVTRFVASVHEAASDDDPVPTVLTCGTVEENLANNAAITDSLRRLGYPAALHRRRDAHNYTAWRDALDPHLVELVAAVAGERRVRSEP